MRSRGFKKSDTGLPHVHDYEELLIGLDCENGHFIDFREKNLKAPFVSFVAQGKVHHKEHLSVIS
jgi:AraC family transcriptional activator of pobA